MTTATTSGDLQLENRVEALLDLATRAGADAADATVFGSDQISVGRRMGQVETLERADSAGVDLRVFLNGQIAQVSGSDLTDNGLARLAERAVGMAKYSPADAFAQLADPDQLAQNIRFWRLSTRSSRAQAPCWTARQRLRRQCSALKGSPILAVFRRVGPSLRS